MFGLTLLVLRTIVANAMRAGNHLCRAMLRQIVRFSCMFLALVIHSRVCDVWHCREVSHFFPFCRSSVAFRFFFYYYFASRLYSIIILVLKRLIMQR